MAIFRQLCRIRVMETRTSCRSDDERSDKSPSLPPSRQRVKSGWAVRPLGNQLSMACTLAQSQQSATNRLRNSDQQCPGQNRRQPYPTQVVFRTRNWNPAGLKVYELTSLGKPASPEQLLTQESLSVASPKSTNAAASSTNLVRRQEPGAVLY